MTDMATVRVMYDEQRSQDSPGCHGFGREPVCPPTADAHGFADGPVAPDVGMRPAGRRPARRLSSAIAPPPVHRGTGRLERRLHVWSPTAGRRYAG